MRKLYIKLILAIAIAIALGQNCHAYTGLIGAEFMVYPLNGWTPNTTNYANNTGFISFIPFEDNTNVTFSRVNDDGSETVIFTEIVDKGEARDLNRSFTDHFFIHILANESGYVYAGSYGALRSPPATNGLFLHDEFIIHWPNNNVGDWGWGFGSIQFLDICTTENETVNVTIIPINASTGQESSFSGLPPGNITFSITGNGIYNDVVCRHVNVTPTGTSINAGTDSTTALVEATGSVFIAQHLEHIDTMNWLGAYDTGLLLGRHYVFGAGYGNVYDIGVDIFNPLNNSVDCSLYCNQSSRGDDPNHFFTAV